MPVKAIVGAQWGDEGKGKTLDALCGNADIVARFNGGDNAGHTVVNRFGKFKLRLIPCGIFHPEATCIIGPGVVINLATLIDEINCIKNAGVDVSKRLWISPRCHVVMPYHQMVEAIYENVKRKARTDTTRRGMGPVHADKVSYNGIRLFDLADETVLAEKLGAQLKIKNPLFKAFDFEQLDISDILQEVLGQYAEVREMVRESFGFLQRALTDDATIVLEGAQGALLDKDWGTYPFCTASTTLVGGAAAGLGIAPRWITQVIGVAKAYTSRVGNGPMPTELLDETGELLRREGQEYGTVTGRARRCGWFDAELVRFVSQLNGFTELALTKLDVLDSLSTLRICTGYRRATTNPPEAKNGTVIAHYWEGDARWLEQCRPVYEELDGWMQPTGSVKEFEQLPKQAQTCVRRIEELVGVPIATLSVGPRRDQTLHVPPVS